MVTFWIYFEVETTGFPDRLDMGCDGVCVWGELVKTSSKFFSHVWLGERLM